MSHPKAWVAEAANCIAARRLLILDDGPAVLRTVEMMARRIEPFYQPIFHADGRGLKKDLRLLRG